MLNRRTSSVRVVLVLLLSLALLAVADHHDVPFTARPAFAAGQILCVNASGGATSAPCGNPTAYTTIQGAVNAAGDGDEIRIARGIYTSGGSRVVSIAGKAVALYGGFESNNWSTSVTSTTTVIDGQATRTATAGDGLFVDDLYPLGQVRLVNVTVASNLRAPHAAIQLRGTEGTIALINTIVTSHTVGLARGAGSTVIGDYNDFFGNSIGQTVGGTATPLAFAHTFNVDPRFVNPAVREFHLRANSLLIGAGNPSRNYSGQRDMDGERVPAEGGPEIGADEFYRYKSHLSLLQR